MIRYVKNGRHFANFLLSNEKRVEVEDSFIQLIDQLIQRIKQSNVLRNFM